MIDSENKENVPENLVKMGLTQEMILDILKNFREVKLVFKKSDGQYRKMYSTLHEDYVYPLSLKSQQSPNLELNKTSPIVCRTLEWEHDESGSIYHQWRSFRYDSLLSLTFMLVDVTSQYSTAVKYEV